MHRLNILQGVISDKTQFVLRKQMPPVFTIRHLSAAVTPIMSPRLATKVPVLAQELLRQWYESGKVEAAGTVDSLPAWRRAA